MSAFKFRKQDSHKLSDHFNSREFACPCRECDDEDQLVDLELVKRLETLRVALGRPISINSAYRCPAKQAALKAAGYETAVGVSQHELGRAADLRATDIPDLAAKAANQFKAIGEAKSFVHVDLRDDKVRRWGYSS